MWLPFKAFFIVHYHPFVSLMSNLLHRYTETLSIKDSVRIWFIIFGWDAGCPHSPNSIQTWPTGTPISSHQSYQAGYPMGGHISILTSRIPHSYITSRQHLNRSWITLQKPHSSTDKNLHCIKHGVNIMFRLHFHVLSINIYLFFLIKKKKSSE